MYISICLNQLNRMFRATKEFLYILFYIFITLTIIDKKRIRFFEIDFRIFKLRIFRQKNVEESLTISDKFSIPSIFETCDGILPNNAKFSSRIQRGKKRKGAPARPENAIGNEGGPDWPEGWFPAEKPAAQGARFFHSPQISYRAARKERCVIINSPQKGHANTKLPDWGGGGFFSISLIQEFGRGLLVPFQFGARCSVRVYLERINFVARYVLNGNSVVLYVPFCRQLRVYRKNIIPEIETEILMYTDHYNV